MTAELIAKWQGVGFAHGELQQLEKGRPPLNRSFGYKVVSIRTQAVKLHKNFDLFLNDFVWKRPVTFSSFLFQMGFVRSPGFF